MTHTIPNPFELYPEPEPFLCILHRGDGAEAWTLRNIEPERELRRRLAAVYLDLFDIRAGINAPECVRCGLPVVVGDHARAGVWQAVRELQIAERDEAAAVRRADEAAIQRKLAGNKTSADWRTGDAIASSL
jgi:hypothetical protein